MAARIGKADRGRSLDVPGMPVARPFLTAEWRDVVLVNYRVDPELLRPFLPPGSDLDTPDAEPGVHLVSVVAFTFARTRVFGVPLPTAQRFGEVNVRFYVRRGPMRATVFLREFVPSPLVVVGARWLYRQPYALARIDHLVERSGGEVVVRTRFARGRVGGEITLRAANEPAVPPPDSVEHFLKEHYWGFDRDWRGRSFRYRVDHPVWRTYPVVAADVGLDPGKLLGGVWAAVDWEASRVSVLLAEGSRAVVSTPEPLVNPDLIGLVDPGQPAVSERRSRADLAG